MNSKITALALVLVVALAGFAGLAAPAAAQDAGNTTLHDETVAVDEDTRALVVSAQNASDVLDVTIYGIDADGLSDEVDTAQLDATGNTTDSYEYDGVDASAYESYRVQVEAIDAVDPTAETISVERVQVVGGGGGIIGGGGGIGLGVAVIGGLALIAYVGRES